MKNLVFGHRGLVGSAIVKALKKSEVYKYDNVIRWVSPDAAELDIALLLEGFREFVGRDKWAIYWAAGKGHMASTEGELLAEERLFSAMCASVGKWTNTDGAVVLISSAGAIWSAPSSGPISESTPPTGASPYAKSKLRQEACLDQLCKQQQLTGFIVRLSSVFGLNQDLQKPQGLISRLCVGTILRQPIEIFVPLETTRNYVFIDDAARMIVKSLGDILGSPCSSGKATIRVICSRDNHSVASVCNSVEVVARRKLLTIVRLLSESSRYPVHFKLRSEHANEFDRFESTTLQAGVSAVYQGALEKYKSGNYDQFLRRD